MIALALALAAQTPSPVKTGLEELVEQGFEPLAGKRVGLVTNHTGRLPDGKSAIDVLAHQESFTLAALFSPEHGIRGARDEPVASGRDEATGLPIWSLYGKTFRPSPESLQDLDVLVYDIQDVGARFYTYITTLGLLMEAAKECDKEVLVLDRPNAIGGEQVEGPVLEDKLVGGFISYAAIPTRHGMTVGELARFYNIRLGCRLGVVKMTGWKRSMYFDETGLPWVNPSPNMRSHAGATHYPGLGALEGTNLSVGRGTEKPFELYGAPWIDSEALSKELNSRGLAGVEFRPAEFTPRPAPGMPRWPHLDAECRGFEPVITDRARYRPVRAGLHAMDALHRLYPKEFTFGKSPVFIGRLDIPPRLEAGEKPDDIAASWDLSAFLEVRARCLLY